MSRGRLGGNPLLVCVERRQWWAIAAFRGDPLVNHHALRVLLQDHQIHHTDSDDRTPLIPDLSLNIDRVGAGECRVGPKPGGEEGNLPFTVGYAQAPLRCESPGFRNLSCGIRVPGDLQEVLPEISGSHRPDGPRYLMMTPSQVKRFQLQDNAAGRQV